MRKSAVAVIASGTALLLGAAAVVAIAWWQSSDFAGRARALEAQWAAYASEGVSAQALAPLRQELQGSGFLDELWSVAWFNGDASRFLSRLQSQTGSVWSRAMAEVKKRAQSEIDAWHQLQLSDGAYLSAASVADATLWPAQLQQASSPQDISKLADQWHSAVSAAEVAVQTAQDQAAVASSGGTAALIQLAYRTAATAIADNLDDLGLGDAAATLQQAYEAGQDVLTPSHVLLGLLASVRQALALNDQLATTIHTVQWDADQAGAEATSHGSEFVSRMQALQQQFVQARNYGQLDAVRQGLDTLDQQVNAELQAQTCGFAVPAGKVITISLALQEMIFYDSGCVVKATPVTTGRPGLRTPAGNYHVFYKTSPFTMVSPWPPGSPDWYPTTQVSWVMEFIGGGYFIHDAAWESPSAFGPGSEDNYNAASHGCVHVPTDTMQWAYSWTPVGTPVLVS